MKRDERRQAIMDLLVAARAVDLDDLADRFAVRRTDPRFWAAADALHDSYVSWAPLEAGAFDLNRLENR